MRPSIPSEKLLQSLERQMSDELFVPKCDIVAHEIANEYGYMLCYIPKNKVWIMLSSESNEWTVKNIILIESVICNILDGKGIQGYGSHCYIEKIRRILQDLLATDEPLIPEPDTLASEIVNEYGHMIRYVKKKRNWRLLDVGFNEWTIENSLGFECFIYNILVRDKKAMGYYNYSKQYMRGIMKALRNLVVTD